MFKISDEVMIFIEKNMKKLENTIDNRRENSGRYVPERCAVTLLFVFSMMPLNHIHRKCTGGYILTKPQEKIDSLNEHGRHQTVC